DAFSSVPNKGNPAGVVLEADALSDKEMQNIAYFVGFNETVFVLKSNLGDLRLRYFTPGHEINLCGHATMASLFCLRSRGFLSDRKSINIETNIGVLPIRFETDNNNNLRIEMKQDKPRFMPFNGDVGKLAESLNEVEFIVEQGQEIQRDGRVWVKAVNTGQEMDISITGTAVFVNELMVERRL